LAGQIIIGRPPRYGTSSVTNPLRAAHLGRTPGLALTAILTLAVAIGATTAIFTIVDSALLRLLSYRDGGSPARAVLSFWESPRHRVGKRDPQMPLRHSRDFDPVVILIVAGPSRSGPNSY